MTTTRGLILLLTDEEDNWAYRSLEHAHEVVTATDFQQTAKMLNNIRCDLLVLDDSTLDEQTSNAVVELKRYFPQIPIAILVKSVDDAQYDHLVSAGADLVLTPFLSTEEFQQQVRIVLHQNVQRRALEARSQKLYLISSLPLMLRSYTDTQGILFQAIKIVINLLDIQAVTVVVNNGNGYRAYRGSKPLLGADQLVESAILTDPNDPIFWSITHRMTQVYNDVYLNPRITVPEGFDAHSAAIIVPFDYPGGDYGAIVFFLPQSMIIVNEDISVYERFVAQVDSILFRAHQNQLQARQLSFSKRLVEGWGTFASANTFQEVVRQLSEMLSSISAVRHTLVAFRNPQTLSELLADNCDGRLVDVFSKPEMQLMVEDLQTEFGDDSHIAVSELADLQHTEAKNSLQRFGSDRFIFIPITVTGERLGYVFITIPDGYRIDALDLHLLENIAQIAINALQQISLKNIALRNHSELMSIVCSISEGVFYVDEHQKVTFYNPQLTELTSISSAYWINQDVDSLLRAIALTSQTPLQTLNQLQTATQRLILNESEGDYPIVSVPLAERNMELSIEFVSINNNSEKPGWLGIVHPIERSQGSMMLERLLERVRVSHSQLHSAINTLSEQHGHFGYSERSELLNQIKIDTTNAGRRWNQFSDLYKLYFGGMSLQREAINLNSLLDRVLKDPRLTRASAMLKLQPLSRMVVINVDEFHFARALSDLFSYLVEVISHDGQLEIRVDAHEREVNIVVSTTSLQRQFTEIEDIFEASNYQSAAKPETLDLYIAAELIRRNGAQIAIQHPGGDKRQLIIAIPIVSVLAQQTSANDKPELVSSIADIPVPEDIHNSTPSREPNSIMLIEGNSKLVKRLNSQLAGEGFSILHYRAGEDAVLDVAATYLDLIIIDLHLTDENGFDICRQIRKRTETPILLVADNATAQEKVQGLQDGADDVITAPVTDEELLARVRVIVNRRYIAARTSEPILFGDLYVDFAHRAVFLKNKPIELTRIEYDILYVLIVNRGQTVTHKQLLTQVWGPEYQDESQYLWVNISRLRKKLEPAQDSPRYIRTQSGVGYYFAVP